jgi:two-component sensor histidine kinase
MTRALAGSDEEPTIMNGSGEAADAPDRPESGSQEAAKQVGDLLSSTELADALESEQFKKFLDNLPVAIVVAKITAEPERIVYANLAFEVLGGDPTATVGNTWSALDAYREDEKPNLNLGKAILEGEEFLGTFRREAVDARLTLVEAYATVIETEGGTERFRLAVLVDVTERELQHREELARAANEKDTLLKELQHRVRNSLQIVTALVRLEARNARQGKTPDFDRIASRIGALSVLYKALLNDGNKQEVDLGEYLSGIASASMSSHAKEGIVLDLKVESCMVTISIAMATGLVVNEVMTNAFKYAFVGRQQGTIKLRCLREGERCAILIGDNGIGLPSGVSWPPPNKISSLIVQSLRENARTEIEVHSKPGEGTAITFAVPLLAPKPQNGLE